MNRNLFIKDTKALLKYHSGKLIKFINQYNNIKLNLNIGIIVCTIATSSLRLIKVEDSFDNFISIISFIFIVILGFLSFFNVYIDFNSKFKSNDLKNLIELNEEAETLINNYERLSKEVKFLLAINGCLNNLDNDFNSLLSGTSLTKDSFKNFIEDIYDNLNTIDIRLHQELFGVAVYILKDNFLNDYWSRKNEKIGSDQGKGRSFNIKNTNDQKSSHIVETYYESMSLIENNHEIKAYIQADITKENELKKGDNKNYKSAFAFPLINQQNEVFGIFCITSNKIDRLGYEEKYYKENKIEINEELKILLEEKQMTFTKIAKVIESCYLNINN